MSKQIPMTKIPNPKQNFGKVVALVLVILMMLSLAANIILSLRIGGAKIFGEFFTSQTGSSVVKPVLAEEIYPLFNCPCCGKPIEQCTCPMAEERKAFVNGLTSGDISEDEAVAAYVKNYGLESFVDKNRQAAFKKKLTAQAPAERPIISASPGSIDLGDVSQAKGEVATVFKIANSGKTDLIINKLDTSCGCTSASIVFEGKEGPKFAMSGHGIENPKDWKVAIPAGGGAQLKVYYDPSVHQDFRGTATREIYIFSNDPINFETKVKIELNQTE